MYIGQRVRILAEVACVAPPPPSKAQTILAGQIGTVVKVQRHGDVVWVEMDCGLPDSLKDLPATSLLGQAVRFCRNECCPAE